MSLAVAAHKALTGERGIDCLPLAIMSELHTGTDRQHIGETASGAIDAAFHGPDRAAANPRRFFVGQARGADQNQGFALIARQLLERGAKVEQVHMRAGPRGSFPAAIRCWRQRGEASPPVGQFSGLPRGGPAHCCILGPYSSQLARSILGLLSFNEAEARAPRMLRPAPLFHFSRSPFNEAEARAPRMHVVGEVLGASHDDLQ